MAKKKKPAPISMSIARKPQKKEAPAQAPQAFNDISPITAKQIERAERDIESLRQEVSTLRKTPPAVQVKSQAPKVDVVLPPRPRITRVKIKYDALGYPAELIPQYSEPAV